MFWKFSFIKFSEYLFYFFLRFLEFLLNFDFIFNFPIFSLFFKL